MLQYVNHDTFYTKKHCLFVTIKVFADNFLFMDTYLLEETPHWLSATPHNNMVLIELHI